MCDNWHDQRQCDISCADTDLNIQEIKNTNSKRQNKSGISYGKV